MIPYIVPVDKESTFHLLEWLQIHSPWLGYVFLFWIILMQFWLIYAIVDMYRMSEGFAEKFSWFVLSLGMVFLVIVLDSIIFQCLL